MCAGLCFYFNDVVTACSFWSNMHMVCVYLYQYVYKISQQGKVNELTGSSLVGVLFHRAIFQQPADFFLSLLRLNWLSYDTKLYCLKGNVQIKANELFWGQWHLWVVISGSSHYLVQGLLFSTSRHHLQLVSGDRCSTSRWEGG